MKDLENSSNKPKSSFGAITGFLFTVSVVVGAGILSLPYSFRMSGWLLSGLYTIFCCLLCYYWGRQLVEVMSRCEALIQLRDNNHNLSRPSFQSVIFGSKSKNELESRLISHEEYPPVITDRRVDLCEMINILFGNFWKSAYMFIFWVLGILSLVSYAVIFASSLTSNLDIGLMDPCNIYESVGFFNDCRSSYWIYLVVFSVIVTYLTIIGMRESKYIQNAMICGTLFNLLLSTILAIISLIVGKDISSDEPSRPEDFKVADYMNVGVSFPIILFAAIYHAFLPSILENVEKKPKSIQNILTRVLVASLIIYMMVGLIMPAAIPDVKGFFNIDFREYSAGYSQSERPWWTYPIAYFIVLYPSIGILSNFPLLAIAVSHNLTTYFYGVVEHKSARLGDYAIKLSTVFLPIAIAFYEYDLGNVTSFAGLFGILMIPVAIPLMHLAAREMLPGKSIYDFKFATRPLSLFIIAFHIVILVFQIYKYIFP
ncbi:unnamed protein product [Blepharisma stoltei]|uniref:Amino acid transporter transmembrane domain-containing protein n=1 Tax=Blepharisma stoltei TaxID=1481888 RepID=A0AAU9K075_9CILI|nr:unnamed protein product [Blepharisma stoltei]